MQYIGPSFVSEGVILPEVNLLHIDLLLYYIIKKNYIYIYIYSCSQHQRESLLFIWVIPQSAYRIMV